MVMIKRSQKIYQWASSKAVTERSHIWLGVIFFLELILFIPLDAVLMFFCLQNRKKTFLYAAIATVASTVSGLIGYLFGHFLWDLVGSFVVPHLISSASFEKISHHFQDYENWAVFFGALVPFPLKALSLSAGVFQLGIGSFVAFFFAARFLRFFLIGTAMVLWGEKVKDFVDRHFHRIIMVVGAKVAVAFVFFWVLAR